MVGYLNVRNYTYMQKYNAEQFRKYQDAFTKISTVIYDDYLEHRKYEDDFISYNVRESIIFRYGESMEEMKLGDEQVELLMHVNIGLGDIGVRGLMSTRAKNGYVIFEDHYGNKMIYSLDGSRPKIKEKLGQFFDSSLYKLSDNWYFYQLVYY